MRGELELHVQQKGELRIAAQANGGYTVSRYSAIVSLLVG